MQHAWGIDNKWQRLHSAINTRKKQTGSDREPPRGAGPLMRSGRPESVLIQDPNDEEEPTKWIIRGAGILAQRCGIKGPTEVRMGIPDRRTPAGTVGHRCPLKFPISHITKKV